MMEINLKGGLCPLFLVMGVICMHLTRIKTDSIVPRSEEKGATAEEPVSKPHKVVRTRLGV